MLTEAKVIVAAPHGDRTRIGRVRLLFGSWKVTTLPLNAFEHAIGIVTFLGFDLLVEECRVRERIGSFDVENRCCSLMDACRVLISIRPMKDDRRCVQIRTQEILALR